jgi:hypothetical protein
MITDDEQSKMVQLVTEYYPEPPTGIAKLNLVSKEVKEKAGAFLRTEILKMSGSEAVLS